MDQKAQLIEAIKKMALNNINTKYERNFEEFRQYNHDINAFLRNNGYNPNQDLVTNDDYLGVLSEFEMKFYKVITKEDEDSCVFIPLKDVNSHSLLIEEKKIYDAAIKLALTEEYSHDLMIKISNGHLTNVVKSSDGSIIKLDIIEDDKSDDIVIKENGQSKIITNKESGGFSNTLILAFIIGSFIGIIFLNIYSKIMK